MEDTAPSHVSRWMLGNRGTLPEPGWYSILLVQSEQGKDDSKSGSDSSATTLVLKNVNLFQYN